MKDRNNAPTVKSASTAARQSPVAWWLFGMAGLVWLMVLVGGATRLTDSGLSITEWKPVSGALPPLSAAAWDAEFEKYKQIPEYAVVNAGMSLDAFKTLYWWEWGHRFLGRLVGFAFLLPAVVFALQRRVDRRLGAALAALFVLGGAQGALGWYMVQSGLTERVDVSQYRLAAHLGLAVFLFAALLWTGLSVRSGGARPAPAGRLGAASWALAIGIYLQIVLGAFVAGLDAGERYVDWPLMNGAWFPVDYGAGGSIWDSHAAVQFNHRIGAYVLAIGAFAFAFAAQGGALQTRARLLAGATLAQGALGVATLMNVSPLGLALAHQTGAIVVFAIAVAAAHHGSIAGRSIANPSSASSSAGVPRGLAGAP
ncbi:MAG: COX15/CtaA family protein [Pseudomonadota bacterium]